MDALLAAYRVGARVSWRGLARTAAAAGLPATTMAEFAELLFAYIDELSAASVAGYNDELNTSGRVRERYRERLGQRLLAGAAPEVLTAAAERAEWTPPTSLTAVLLPAAQVHGVLALLEPDTLLVGEDLPGADAWDLDQPYAVLLVPDVAGRDRRHLLRVLGGARPWSARRGRGPASAPPTTARSVRCPGRLGADRRAGRHRGPPRRPGGGGRSGGPGRPAPRARAVGRLGRGDP